MICLLLAAIARRVRKGRQGGPQRPTAHPVIGIARERADFSDELAEEVRRLGGGWREVEERIRPKDDAALVVECVNGEENTLRHYEHALTEDLPAPVRPVVERQRLAVQEVLLELRAIELAPKAG